MKRLIYRSAALLCMILGIIGALLPVMPTVPFLLAALYFAADDPSIKNFICSNRFLRFYLDSCRGKRPVSPAEKIAALCGLWLSLGISGYFFAGTAFRRIILAAVGVIFSLFILRIKSEKKQ